MIDAVMRVVLLAAVLATASLPHTDADLRQPTTCVQLNRTDEVIGITSVNDVLAVASRFRVALYKVPGSKQKCQKLDEFEFKSSIDKLTEFKLLNETSVLFCDNKECRYCLFGAVRLCRDLNLLVSDTPAGAPPAGVEVNQAVATQTSDAKKILLRVVLDTLRSFLFTYEEPLLDESLLRPVGKLEDSKFLQKQHLAYAFAADGFTYFVSSAFQPYEPLAARGDVENKPGPAFQVKIGRVCDSDERNSESRVELTLGCPGVDNTTNRGVSSAVYSATDRKVIVLFATPGDDVACAFHLDDINRRAAATWRTCQDVTYTDSEADCKSPSNLKQPWQLKAHCKIFTHSATSRPCSMFGADSDMRYLNMCELGGFNSNQYRFGALENYEEMPGKRVAVIETRGYKFSSLFLDRAHASLFLTSDDRLARANIFLNDERKANKSAPPALIKFFKPSTRFALAHVTPASFLLIDHDRVEEQEISCASLYAGCEALAKGGFADPLGCAFCAVEGLEGGGYVMDRSDKGACKTILFNSCPPVIREAHQHAERKEQWSVAGESLNTLYQPVATVCGQPCTIEVITEKSVTCTLKSAAVLDATCRFDLNGRLEGHQFKASPIAATRDSGTQTAPIPHAQSDAMNSRWWKILIGVVAIVLIILLIVAIILCARKYLGMGVKKANGSIGMLQFDTMNTYPRNAARNTYLSTDPSGMPFAQNISPANFPIYERLFREIDDRLKIPSDHLLLEKQIGKGHFGVVIKGTYTPPGGPTRAVACKTLTGHVTGGISEFVNEGLMMDRFNHPRVMSLVGISFNEERMPIIVTDYMENGDLAKYLRDVNNKPTLRDLLNFTLEIAQGMQYLHDNKFIHRDLAARNCMLDRDSHVKVADFGLCREATSEERDEYLPVHSGREMPLRWMSPEALEKEQFTMAGDVWAFGVVIWEVMTRGMNPYPNLQAYVLFEFLKAGKRMGKPDFCPDILYRVMWECWAGEPTMRPTFNELPEQIEEIIDVLSSNSRVQMNAEYEQCNSVRNSRAASSSAITPTTHHAISHVHSVPLDEDSPDPAPV